MALAPADWKNSVYGESWAAQGRRHRHAANYIAALYLGRAELWHSSVPSAEQRQHSLSLSAEALDHFGDRFGP